MAGSLQRSRSFCQASVHLHQLISVLVFAVRAVGVNGCSEQSWSLSATRFALKFRNKSNNTSLSLFSQLEQRQSGNKELQAFCKALIHPKYRSWDSFPKQRGRTRDAALPASQSII